MNHLFISENLLKNFSNEYIEHCLFKKVNFEFTKIIKLIDESITNFIIIYYNSLFDKELVKNYSDLIKIDLRFSKEHILGFYKQFLQVSYKNFDIQDINTFSFGGLDYDSLVYHWRYLIIFLTDRFGEDILSKMIKFLYFSRYKTMEEITKNLFNMEEQKFYELWSLEAKKNK